MRWLIGLLALGLHCAAHASQPTWHGAEIRQFGQSATRPERMYAATGLGILFRSDDRGLTWTPLRVPGAEYTALLVDPKDAEHVLVLSRNRNTSNKPGLHESLDGGRSWTQRAPLKYSQADGAVGGEFFPTRLAGPAAGTAGDWWAYDGRWFRSADSGRTWLLQSGEQRRAFGAVQGGLFSYSLDGNVLWRSGDAEQQSWEKVHEFGDSTTRSLDAFAPSKLMALDDGELVVRSKQGDWLQSNDRGVSWTPASNGFQNLNGQPASAGTQPAVRFHGETRCDVLRSPAAAGMLLARCVWDNGAMPSSTCFHVSADSGRSWTPPRVQGDRPGADCRTPGLPSAWSPTAVWMDSSDPRRMFAAWMAGGLYRSDDAGKTWQASDAGLMFRNGEASQIEWLAVGEPALVQAVLRRDPALLARVLASGVDINASGNHLGGVLEADLVARETEASERNVPQPLMWSELRKAGASSPQGLFPGMGLMERAIRLKLDDVTDDLIRLGYDWGKTPSTFMEVFAPESEFNGLLRRSNDSNAQPAQVQRWVQAYIAAARFPSADQTTLDLLNNNYPELAVKVLKASTRRTPFDRQSTPPRGLGRPLEQALLAAGKKAWAKRVIAASP